MTGPATVTDTSKPPWPISIATHPDFAKSSSCVYPSDSALPDVKLPKRLILEGPNGYRQLVGPGHSAGGGQATIVWVTEDLLKTVVPDKGILNALKTGKQTSVGATLRPAGFGDLVVYLKGETVWAIVGAVLVLVGAIAAIALLFFDSSAPLWLIGVAAVAGGLGALLSARSEIRKALTPCDGG